MGRSVERLDLGRGFVLSGEVAFDEVAVRKINVFRHISADRQRAITTGRAKGKLASINEPLAPAGSGARGRRE